MKLNEPGTERQVLNDLTHVDSKNIDLTEVESRMVVTRIQRVEWECMRNV
jgi:hypothetical protein